MVIATVLLASVFRSSAHTSRQSERVPSLDSLRYVAEAERAAYKEALLYIEAEKDLYTFLKAVWPLLEPGRKFLGNWHIKAMAKALQRVVEDGLLTNDQLGEMGRTRLNRLIINVPYRTSKSTLISVAFPVWAWLRAPGLRFLTGSHKDTLATRDAVRSRRLIQSAWFQKGWGDRFTFLADTNQKTRYENDKTGYRISFGMTTGVTGEGGDILMLDDPNNSDAMFSVADREHVNNMYDQGLSSRLNDEDRSAVVVVMQRFHVEDLCGHLLDKGGWTHIRLPMLFEPEDVCEVPEIGFKDPRTEPDELMWERRFGRKWVAEQHRNLGSLGIACQLQQRPVPSEGGMINLSWFRRFDAMPSMDQVISVIQFWDTAQKANELTNAPWVGGTWLQTEAGYWLVKVERRWMTYPTGKRAILSEYEWASGQFGPPSALVIEDKSTGASLIQEFMEETTLPVVRFEPEKDKVTRLGVESPTIEAGNVWLPRTAEWLNDFEREIQSFPNSTTMDQADMLSMALRYFRDGGYGPRIRDFEDD